MPNQHQPTADILVTTWFCLLITCQRRQVFSWLSWSPDRKKAVTYQAPTYFTSYFILYISAHDVISVYRYHKVIRHIKSLCQDHSMSYCSFILHTWVLAVAIMLVSHTQVWCGMRLSIFATTKRMCHRHVAPRHKMLMDVAPLMELTQQGNVRRWR